MDKRCKLVMLPSNEKAQIHIIPEGYMYKSVEEFIQANKDYKSYHLYITADDKIKDGDWCILFDDFGYVMSTPQQYLKTKAHVLNSGLKKIIATTDSSLKTKVQHDSDGFLNIPLPQPSQYFIQKCVDEYNKGNQIVDVLVEYDEEWINPNPKYDTLKISKDNTITIRRVKDSWSRNEVADKIRQYQHSVDRNEVTTIAQWIKENL